MTKQPKNRALKITANSLAVFGLTAALYSSAALADFTLNFAAPGSFDSGSVSFSCQPGSGLNICDDNEGAFAQQIVTINGAQYWKNTMGDPATGFAYQYYTRYRGFQTNSQFDGAGLEQSAGWVNDCTSLGGAFGNTCGNGEMPFDSVHLSGSGGSGNPDKTTFRLSISGNGLDMEVYKPLLGRKPLISESITSTSGSITVRSDFQVDERNLLFSDIATAAPITNSQVISDPALQGAGNFDMRLAKDSVQAAGQYSFTPGLGPTTTDAGNATPNDPGYVYDLGVYSYTAGGGSFDPYTANWASFFNLADNPGCSDPAASSRLNKRPGSCP